MRLTQSKMIVMNLTSQKNQTNLGFDLRSLWTTIYK